VREAKGQQSAQLIEHLKKADMAKEAERLLDGTTGWLPEPLRIAEVGTDATDGDAAERAEALPVFLADDEESTGEEEADQPALVAAE